MHLTSSFTKSSLTLCCLAFGLAQAGAQTPNGTQIIGYNNNGVDTTVITDLQNSPYTTFIDGFFQPTGSSTASDPGLEFDTLGTPDGPLDANRVAAFNQVEGAGKNVLLSFGGAGAASYYSAFANPGTASNGNAYTAAQATQTLANYLAAYVTGASSYVNYALNPAGQTVNISTYAGSTKFNGFSGIDLDFEDTQSFLASGTYNGATFVSQLTIDLRNQFSKLGVPNAIITQAPQTPYLDPAYTTGGGSYASTGGYQAILAGGANSATTWLNVQFYNNNTPNGGDDGNNSVSGVVQAFEKLVTANPGIAPGKFVLTLPINQKNANDNYFTAAQITEIVGQINDWLKSKGDGTIGGIAGFQLYNGDVSPSQRDATNLAFANAFLSGVVPEPSTWALVACGIAGLGWTLRRRASRAGL